MDLPPPPVYREVAVESDYLQQRDSNAQVKGSRKGELLAMSRVSSRLL
jgi:hypothetical protein